MIAPDAAAQDDPGRRTPAGHQLALCLLRHDRKAPPANGTSWVFSDHRASGEINEEEYRHRLAVLRGESQPANGQARPPAGTSTR